MKFEPNDSLLENLPADATAGTLQAESINGAGLSETADGPTVFAEGESASDEAAAQLLAQKHGVDFIDLSEMELSPHIVHLLPSWLAIQHNVIAIKFEEDTLHLAISNPLDLPTLEQVRMVTSFHVKPVLALEIQIAQAIKDHYGVEQMIRQDLVDARFEQDKTDSAAEEMTESVSREESGQAVRLINSILNNAIDVHASDIHLEPAENELIVRFRIDGMLRDMMRIPSTARKEVISRIKILANLDITEKRKSQDGHVSFYYKEKSYDLRISVMPTIEGGKIVIRVLDKSGLITDFTGLGLEQENIDYFEQIVTMPSGMVLVTGPTGSGKTTTLYSMLNQINATEKNIVTIENPVEYKLDRINQIQINPHGGETFGSSLKAILRQDPDVIMIGEIRDLETAEIAVQAALTGHLVLSTLHTSNAAGAIVRLTELGVPSFLTASCIMLSVAQRLLRKVCPKCQCQYHPDHKVLEMLKMDEQGPAHYVQGQGCSHCSDVGFRGREGVFEILKIDTDIQTAILENKNTMEISRLAKQKGMKTLMESAKSKVAEGITTVEEIKRVIGMEEL